VLLFDQSLEVRCLSTSTESMNIYHKLTGDQTYTTLRWSEETPSLYLQPRERVRNAVTVICSVCKEQVQPVSRSTERRTTRWSYPTITVLQEGRSVVRPLCSTTWLHTDVYPADSPIIYGSPNKVSFDDGEGCFQVAENLRLELSGSRNVSSS
jgi:hypothetical protein